MSKRRQSGREVEAPGGDQAESHDEQEEKETMEKAKLGERMKRAKSKAMSKKKTELLSDDPRRESDFARSCQIRYLK